MTHLSDLPSFIYGTTRLGGDDVPRVQQQTVARSALDLGLWLHTSRQYGHALELLGEVISDHPDAAPSTIIKLGGGTAEDVRAEVEQNLRPLGLPSVSIGQLSPVQGLDDGLVRGGAVIDDLQRLKGDGLVGRFVLEIFPWTSAAPLAALRAGQLDGLVDGFIFYLNPLQRFASNELWDELLERGESIISMRTVAGAPVHELRDVPGAAWRPYLQQRAVEVVPVFERSGVQSWPEFCVRFAHSTPQVVSTVGSTSRPENLAQLVEHAQDPQPLSSDIVAELFALQRRWADDVDAHAEPWTM